MSKQSNNAALLCASLLVGLTQVSFAAGIDPSLVNIPPPPVLRNPYPESGPTSATANPNSAAALVGTTRGDSATPRAPSATVVKPESPNAGLFTKNSSSNAAATQSATTAAVNAATQEAARQAATRNASPQMLTWGFQQLPAANTMYSNPQRK